MPSYLGNAAILSVAVIAGLYQLVFKGIIFDTLGYGRSISSINTYSNARCEKIDNLGLEGCEDMWLHEPTGFLYMACTNSQSRTQWLPAFVQSIHNHVTLLTFPVLII
jgi:arylesterase/paraoxonase